MDISLVQALILMGLGLTAGIINTLAGGGSNLTVPALMMLGLPADIANATNRVGVFLQTVVGVKGFSKHKKLPLTDFKSIIIPLFIGAIVGSASASFIPAYFLKYLLLLEQCFQWQRLF